MVCVSHAFEVSYWCIIASMSQDSIAEPTLGLHRPTTAAEILSDIEVAFRVGHVRVITQR